MCFLFVDQENPLAVSHDNTNATIFQLNRRKKYIFVSVKFNVVFKERSGFPHS